MIPPSDIKADLTQSLKNLHLPTIRQCYEEVARQAEREQLSYERYLHELVQRECDDRQENRTTKMLRESQLPLEKSLEAFDTRRLPPKAARQMRTLLDGGFLERTENVLVFGNPGSGKTHMLQARPGVGAPRPSHAFHHLRNAGAGTADRQAGSAAQPPHQEVLPL